jgi:RND family efflux transporter MFP subunit
MTSIIQSSFIFSIFVATAAFAQQGANQANGTPSILVEVDKSKTELVAEQVWVSGTVISRADASISSEVAGKINWIADVGDVVKKGDVLAKVDDKVLILQKQQHLANITKLQSRVRLLERRESRMDTMLQNNNASQDEFEELVSQLEFAIQDLAQAKLDLAQTELMLSLTEVRAPFTALIAERMQTLGEYTNVGQQLLRVVDTNNIEVSIRAPLSTIAFIDKGTQVEVKDNNQTLRKSVRTLVPVGNALSRMMEVRVQLDAEDFPIGGAVRVALPNSEYHKAITVPRDALVLREAGMFIYTVDENNVAEQIPVSTGIGVGERIEIIGTLKSDAAVIIRGAERVTAGQKVKFAGIDV